MLRSLGIPELILLSLILLLLFGGRRLSRLGQLAGQWARKPVRKLAWLWTSATGTEQETLERERDFGRDLARDLASRYSRPVAPTKQAVIDRLGAALSACAGAPWPCSYRLLPDPTPNACALPGGFIFVFEPLYDLFSGDEDALAFILAHETAHVALGHARENFWRELILGHLAPAAGAGALAKTLLSLAYSRDEELEADREAVSLMTRTGFQPAGALTFFRRIGGGGGPLTEIFSTHPPAQERLKALEACPAFHSPAPPRHA